MVDFKEFVLSDDVDTSEEAPKKTKKTLVNHNVDVSGVDIIVTRKTSRSESYLVLLPSRQQYYIKETGGSIVELTPANLSKFIGSEPLELNASWVKKLTTGLVASSAFIEFLNSSGNLIKEDMAFWYYEGKYQNSNAGRACRSLLENEKLFLRIRKAFPELSSQEFFNAASENACYYNLTQEVLERQSTRVKYLLHSPSLLNFLNDKFGISGVDLFINTMKELPFGVALSDNPGVYNKLSKYEFSCKKFVEYMLYGRIHQGLFLDSSFVSNWLDTLQMQETVFGKIVDKYPEHLSSEHDKLSAICRIRREEYDEKKWEHIVEDNSDLEFANSKIVAMLPKNKIALTDEATQQSNCVAGYSGRFLNEECLIVFIRHAKEPETSWITVEIRDKHIVQAKLKHNKSLDREAAKALETFANEKELEINEGVY